MFGFVDANKDGFIDLKETQSMVDYTKKQGASQLESKMEQPNKVTSRQIIESMDKDKDGKISKQRG